MGKAILVGVLGCFLSGCVASSAPYTTVTPAAAYSDGKPSTSTGYMLTPEEYERRIQETAESKPPSWLTSRGQASAIVTTGSLSQPYEALGTVEADTTDIGLSTSDLYD